MLVFEKKNNNWDLFFFQNKDFYARGKSQRRAFSIERHLFQTVKLSLSISLFHKIGFS